MKILIALVTLALVFAAPALAVPYFEFEYKVDSFEITGNGLGTIIDNFDDGVVAPWLTYAGKVTETGGYLVLSGPGLLTPAPGFPGIWLERSDAKSPSSYYVASGLGAFTATSTWAPIIPESPGGFYGMSLYYLVPPDIVGMDSELVGISIANLSSDVAANWTGGPSGLQILQVVWAYESDFSDGEFLVANVFPIDAVDVVGDILFEFDYDDITGEVVHSYSLDAGASWVVLPAISTNLDLATSEGMWLMTGDPMEYVPEPTSAALLLPGLLLLGVLSRKRMKK